MRSRRSGVSIISYNGDVFAVGGFDGTSRLKTSEVRFSRPIAPPVDLKILGLRSRIEHMAKSVKYGKPAQ